MKTPTQPILAKEIEEEGRERMVHQLTINIPEDIVRHYHSIEDVKQVMLEDFVTREYQQGNISMRQGAAMLGLTYEEFMIDFLGRRKISFINGIREELDAETLQENRWLDDVLGAAQ